MAEPMLPNLLGAYLQARQVADQDRLQREEQARLSRVRGMGNVAFPDQPDLQAMWQADPRMAMQIGQNRDEQKWREIMAHAKLASEPERWSPSGGFLVSNLGNTREIPGYTDQQRAIANARQRAERDNAPPPAPRPAFRTLTPQEVAARGLPAGTVVQVDDATGKMDVVREPPKPAVSPKDVNTARQKLTQIAIARQQLENAKTLFAQSKGVTSGPLQGWFPSASGKSFDAAIDAMRGTIGGLTRIPGVGAMSDYEGRLDQAKFPSRTDYEEVQAQKLQQLDDLITGLERGYTDLLSSNDTAESSPGIPAPPIGTVKNGWRFKGGNPADKNNWEKTK